MASTLKNGQKDGVRFSVYLRPCQLEWLDAQAEKMGVSRSKFIELKTFPKELQLLKDKKGAKKRMSSKAKRAKKNVLSHNRAVVRHLRNG
jgi:hypothetical protein